MSLSSALSVAQNSLLNTQRQIGVVSRNVADANNPNYARRSVHHSSLTPGAQIAEIRRSTNEALQRQNLNAVSGYSAQNEIMEGLDRLSQNVNGAENMSSAAAALSGLQEALQLYSSNPSNDTLAANTVEAARKMVRSLNGGTASIQEFRTDTDKKIGDTVDRLNRMLSQFHDVNSKIVTGTQTGRDVNDALDQRDELLTGISEIIPISSVRRKNDDMMLVTADGAMLYETVPREVSFNRTAGFDAETDGDGIRIDGIPVSMGVGGDTTASGSLGALLQLRDDVSHGMQLQLDEITRGLNEAIPGLMTHTGDMDDPGIAGRVSLNADIDPDGDPPGDPQLLRDGILINENVDDHASFNDVLLRYSEDLEASRTFTTASGASATFNLSDYASDALSWLEANRKEASNGSDTKSALLMRTNEALSNATNVNVDEEMALLLELENSYGASARILQTIDQMLASLLEAAR